MVRRRIPPHQCVALHGLPDHLRRCPHQTDCFIGGGSRSLRPYLTSSATLISKYPACLFILYYHPSGPVSFIRFNDLSLGHVHCFYCKWTFTSPQPSPEQNVGLEPVIHESVSLVPLLILSDRLPRLIGLLTLAWIRFYRTCGRRFTMDLFYSIDLISFSPFYLSI